MYHNIKCREKWSWRVVLAQIIVRSFARDPSYNELFLWVHKCFPKALGILPLIRYTSSYIECRQPFLPQKIQIFPVKHHVSSPPTPGCLHFTVPLKGVNFKALESAAKTYLCQSPPLPDWREYSWLEYHKDITLKTVPLLKLDWV